MTSEVAILRAYALLSQGAYAEAEELLGSVPEALQTPSGADLYARLRFEQGAEDEAKSVWESILTSCPDYEPAAKALEAYSMPSQFDEDDGDPSSGAAPCGLSRRLKVAAVAAVVVGVLVSVLVAVKTCGSQPVPQHDCKPSPPTVIAEMSITGAINGKTLTSLREGFLTNLTEDAVLVVRGGAGKYITDRQKKLAVIADCLSEVAKVPISKMYIQPATESTDEIVLQIVPAWLEGRAEDQ